MITTGGGGGKHYSLGLDLEELSALSPPEKVDFFNEFQRLMHRTLTFPMVTVAAINGKYDIIGQRTYLSVIN